LAALLVCPLRTVALAGTEMAITIDDLPAHGAAPQGMQRVDIARRIISVLKEHAAPGVYGFANGAQIRDNPGHLEILKHWVQAGFHLGNHTFSHLDIDRVTAAEYIADIERNETFLADVARGDSARVFRYPYLHEGDTLLKKTDVRQWLARRHYRIAHVTVHFDDWAWNDAYARCVGRSDERAIDYLKQSFMKAAMDRFEWARAVSHTLFKRQIRHILLLHMGAFDALMLDELLRAYQNAGMTAITLRTAMEDPAYTLNDAIVSQGEMPFLLRVAQARRAAIPPVPTIPLERLNAVCR
jgi:peptidoglycan/xylan/chitin deacetylase (PgdA/CDA1 family)